MKFPLNAYNGRDRRNINLKALNYDITSIHLIYRNYNVNTVEPSLKETPNKGNLSVMNRKTCPKSYVIQRFHCIYMYIPQLPSSLLFCTHIYVPSTGQMNWWSCV